MKSCNQVVAEAVGRIVSVNGAAACDRSGLSADAAVVTYALSYLAAVFGGSSYPPGRAQMERVLEFVNGANFGRRTAGGVIFDLRRDALYLMRESRNIAPLSVLPGEKVNWDGRFEVENFGSTAVRISAPGAVNMTTFPSNLPGGVVKRAEATMPSIVTEEGDEAPRVALLPRLAPFDRFLTRFDLTFADRLSAAFGREAYRRLPLSAL